MPSARSTSALDGVVAARRRAPRAPAARWPACVSGPSRITCGARARHSAGNCSSTSGRASASTMSGRSRRLRSAASTKLTVGRSPQCRSSSTSSTGAAAHSAASQSSHARRIGSPISCGFGARGAERTLSSSGNGTPRARRGTRHPPRASRSDVARDPRAQLRRADLERLAVVDAGGAPDRAAPASRTASPRPADRRRRTAPRARSGCRCTHSTNSWRRRDLPTPGRADDQHRARHRFGHASPRTGPSSIDISRSRPTHGVALPSRLRLHLDHVALARAGTARCRRAGPRSARRAARPSRRRGGSRRAAGPAQQAHAAVDHLARHRPGREPPRPRRRPPAATSGSTRAHRQRAARRARRLIGRLARRRASVRHDDAVGERVQPRAVRRAPASSSSAASRRS